MMRLSPILCSTKKRTSCDHSDWLALDGKAEFGEAGDQAIDFSLGRSAIEIVGAECWVPSPSSRRLNIGVRKIFADEEQRLVRAFGHDVGTAIDKIQCGRVAALAID